MTTKIYSLVLVLAFLASAIAYPLIVGPRARTKVIQSTTEVRQQQTDAPIADFNAPQESDPQQRAKRVLRNKRHNLINGEKLTAENRAEFVLKEDKPVRIRRPANAEPAPSAQIGKSNHKYTPPVVGAAVTDDSPAELALPTYNSDAVVIGNIRSAKAFMSEDKTTVYSEFGLQLSEVLKNSSSAFDPLASLIVLRPGGGVRFPSGNVKYFLVDGRGLPHMDRRYLLFLKYDELAESFYIVTGYELNNGRVFPLDSIPPYGTDAHPFGKYLKYKGVEESKFLADVADAIVHPSVPPQTGFPVSQGTPN